MSDETRKQGSVLPLGESLAGFLCSDGVFRVKSGEFRRATVGEWWQDKANGRVYCVNSEYPQDILVEPDLPAPSQTEGGGPDDTKQVSKEQGASPSVTPGVTKNVGDDRTGETDEGLAARAKALADKYERLMAVTEDEVVARMYLNKAEALHHLCETTNETKAEPLGEAPKPEPAAAVPGEGEITVNRDDLARLEELAEDALDDLAYNQQSVAAKNSKARLRSEFDRLRAALDGDKEGPA